MVEKDIKIKNWELEYQQRNNHPILMADLWCRSLCLNFEKEINIPRAKYTEYLFSSPRNGYVNIIQKKNITFLLEGASSSKKYLQFIFEKTLDRVDSWNNFADNTIKQLDKKNHSKKEIINLWIECDKILLDLIPWFFIPYYITEESILTDKVLKRLKKYSREIEKYTDFNNAVGILIFPNRKMLFQKEQEDFSKLVKIAGTRKDYLKDKEFLSLRRKYLDNYSWMKTFLILPIEPLNLSELTKRIKFALKDNYLDDNEIKIKQRIKNKKLLSLILNIIKTDKKLLEDIKWSQQFGWLLTASVEKALIAGCKLIPFYKVLAKNFKISYKDWVYLTSNEIIEILRGGKLPIKEVERRKKGFVFLTKNNVSKIYTGKRSEEIHKKLELISKNIDPKTKELMGQSAMSGKTTGKVCVILEGKDSYKLKSGDILVCSMTSPDYISAMKKSAGIITDEGGLLSHAAIISRELSKPCIIGTKIATKVLKDGDLVEVDANKGVVKIVKRNGRKRY